MSSTEQLINKINELKKKRCATLLVHNYQPSEIQDIADYQGDSLELSRRANELPEDVIVFCGVHFMAETAALLSPEKIVLLPDENSGCPMADMVTADDVLALRKKHPNAVVVCYVNSTAAVKAVSDVCCTSSNAVDIVSRIADDVEIIFVPDQYLGGHVERMTGRKMIFHPGYCPTHARILPEHLDEARKTIPGAPIIVHPECRGEVCVSADEVLSTGGMVKYAAEAKASTIIVGTEIGLLHRLQKENPSKKIVPLLEKAVCPNMKLTTLEKIVWSLEDLKPRIQVPPQTAIKAKQAVLAMLGDGPIIPRKY